MHISVSQLPQIDRLQNDSHRFPVVHQEQNAQTADSELTRRMAMPVEPDAIEKKQIDPERKKDERNGRGRKRKNADQQVTDRQPGRQNGTSFIDLTA
jgi:hypothetical protein